ncbi:MAG TPA: tail fiber protein [Thermoanaerobaculia bacterium]|nr:tail fiber protein [Thermoanaerobaculia bacterium]
MHVGEIRLIAGNYEPEAWAWCDGRMLDPKQYPDLFQKIGTRYGGDGKTTFAIPDLRGRAPMHRAGGMQLGTAGSIQFDAGTLERRRARIAVNHIIGLTRSDRYPDYEPMTGEVRLWAAERTPKDWIVCRGQLLPISQNTMLFALLSNAFGGDARTTFAVPHLENAFAIHPSTPEERGRAAGVDAQEGETKPLLALQYCLAMKGLFPSRWE